MSNVPVQRDLRTTEEEVLQCHGKYRARFKMLFSADRTATDSLTCGVASVGPREPLPLHRHAHPEVYFGLAGMARVRVGAEEFLLSEGTALFIPGNIEHAVHADEPAKFFFAFAADSYSDVRYIYLDDD
ncbi:cupin domain-containing protein [Halomonas korlensis]|uniref:Cupin domain-containing protein n=1 Tax=Halomonas korlensis TaxID=463301 RepID=A0A1I7FJW4_9GAMM|nr:cupin domain-containing protein [Halomonas korlensis]SFU36489.1 Cupin domain-containing protein [Halomonas korlensis]